MVSSQTYLVSDICDTERPARTTLIVGGDSVGGGKRADGEVVLILGHKMYLRLVLLPFVPHPVSLL